MRTLRQQGDGWLCGLGLALGLCLALGCEREVARGAVQRGVVAKKKPAQSLAAKRQVHLKQQQARIEREYPLHGLVTGVHLVVREKPARDAEALGWVRMGARLRLKAGRHKGANCASGWVALYPRGWLCSGQGVQVGQAPQRSKVAVDAPRQDAALPFRYFYVKESGTPEYHRPPSRNEQRAARAFAERYRALLVEDEAKARAFLQRWADAEPPPPAVVRRVLDRGFYVAGVRTEVRASRRFLRTLKGTYIKMAKLEERHGSDFHGIELGEALSLPLAFAVRAARPMIKRERADGSIRFRRDSEAAAIARHAVVEGWLRRERIGAHKMHVLSGDRYLHDWFVAVAEARKPPKVVGPDEVWIHVDRANQVLVLYEGKTPRFVTLVSTGLPEHETPVGRFRIRKKFISDTMSALGPDAGDDRYRIEDVPWTQYFSGAIALHGAFWHDRFGLQRSHGCVNLAPRDAHTIFNFTQPELVDGWHGRALPPRRQAKGTLVWVTE